MLSAGCLAAISLSAAFPADLAICAAEDAPTSGTCGEHLTWALDADGTLTVSGTGSMTDYKTASETPWYASRAVLKKAVLESGVTTVGEYAFGNCESLAQITIPDTVTAISAHSFIACYALENVAIPESVTEIGDFAFYACGAFTEISLPDSAR